MSDERTRTRILDVAQDLVQRFGANAVSYQHISEAVGIRKPSIHHHFPTKGSLIEALIERYSDYFLELVNRIIESDISQKQKLEKYISLFEATLRAGNRDKACLCGMLGAELASLGTESAVKVRHFYEENEERLARILEEGRKAKEFRFEGDARATSAMIFSLLEGAVLISRAQGGTKHFKSIARQLMTLLGA